MRKILFISEHFRYDIRRGSDKRVYTLLKYLLDNFEVTWLACEFYGKNTPLNFYFANHPNLNYTIAKVPARTIYRRFINKFNGFLYNYLSAYSYDTKVKILSLLTKIREINIEKYDAIILSYLAHYDFIKILKEEVSIKIKILIDTNDIQFKRMRYLYKEKGFFTLLLKTIKLKLMEKDEKKALLNADYLVAISREDENYFKNILKHSGVLYCPTGFELEEISQLKYSRNIIFFGTMDSIINIKGVKYFKNEIFPLIKELVPNATFTILGNNPTNEVLKLKDESTFVTGYVENPKEYLIDAGCLVCPIAAEYGQRIRIIESLIYGLPIVTFSKAVTGMELEEMDGVFICDDVKTFAKIVIKLLLDSDYQLKIKKNILKISRERFNYLTTYKPIFDIIIN